MCSSLTHPHERLSCLGVRRITWPARRQWAFSLCLGCAWAATLVMAVFVVLRWLARRQARLVWVNSFTVYFYLPAYVCLAWAVWQRQRWLAALNLLIVAFHLSWVVPELLPIDRSPPATVGVGGRFARRCGSSTPMSFPVNTHVRRDAGGNCRRRSGLDLLE